MDVPASQDSGCLTGFFGRSSEVSSIVKASAVKKKKITIFLTGLLHDFSVLHEFRILNKCGR